MNTDVYSVVRLIPEGYVSTYAEIAKQIGRPKAFRAVGTILSKNLFPYETCHDLFLRVPCHRVVKSDGTIGGFFGETSGDNVNKKIDLLKSEGVNVVNGVVQDFKSKMYRFE